jgi:hypothetical protein
VQLGQRMTARKQELAQAARPAKRRAPIKKQRTTAHPKSRTATHRKSATRRHASA